MRERTREDPVDAGLCLGCLHARRLESAKGSIFWQCELARDDPRFRQYPQLPVRVCLGFQPASRRSGSE